MERKPKCVDLELREPLDSFAEEPRLDLMLRPGVLDHQCCRRRKTLHGFACTVVRYIAMTCWSNMLVKGGAETRKQAATLDLDRKRIDGVVEAP